MTLALAGLAALAVPRPAAAQYSGSAGFTVGRPYYESSGPGYTTYIPSATFAGRYDFYPGKYTGYPMVSRFATTNGYYGTLSSGYTPIMMTSLNYPEIYGSYVLGPTVAPKVGPTFQTRIDNRPSDNPVGAPYAPLARPLVEVPEKATISTALTTTTLSTNRAAPARTALIDVFLPESATLSFQGVTMKEEGAVRAFQSPPLEPGRTYHYDLRAAWRTEGGKEVVRTRRLTVRAGDRLEVDLNGGAMQRAGETEEPRPTLRTQPLPSRNVPRQPQ
jgi:uncharacterized protein (TIGR03000 family)